MRKTQHPGDQDGRLGRSRGHLDPAPLKRQNSQPRNTIPFPSHIQPRALWLHFLCPVISKLHGTHGDLCEGVSSAMSCAVYLPTT